MSARPALPYSLISDIPTNGESGKKIDGILEVEYGYYPQTAVSKKTQSILENTYNCGKLLTTGYSYTIDSRKYNEYNQKFLPKKIREYKHNGKRYVRVKANSYFDGYTFKLSNGEEYVDGNYVWVEVEPVKWLVDESGIMLSEKLLFAGVQFNHERNYKGNFNTTDIKKYLDDYFSKDLLQAYSLKQTEKVSEEKSTRKKNPYNFNFNNVSEEEIIKGALESNIAVFLHGRSSEGKSARVKQFDPDPEIIYLRNATPESLNGKSVYNSVTGEMLDIPPTWFKKIQKKCEEEKDKIHIVFFDEITNALPSIQGMAFNIVLDGEVNGIWKLPENARIVAAGNDLNDSLAANTMAEPLFNRFAHVYINTTTNNWLKWATTPKTDYERLNYNKIEETKMPIHPSIVAYITYKKYSNHDVLRTPYNGEKPNADPRKWEMASKVLYATKQPEILRALVGEEITIDFTQFCRQQVLSVDDIVNGNYSESDLAMNTAEKFATAVGLSSVDMKNFEIVRNFMQKVGAEPRATFESIWARGDEKRLEYIAEIQMKEISMGGKSK